MLTSCTRHDVDNVRGGLRTKKKIVKSGVNFVFKSSSILILKIAMGKMYKEKWKVNRQCIIYTRFFMLSFNTEPKAVCRKKATDLSV